MNIQQMMQQAQQMQKKMQAEQAKLKESEFIGTAANGAVEITMNGSHSVKKVQIKPDVVDLEDLELLEDSILIAINECESKIKKAEDDSVSSATGGMKLPF